MAGITLERLYSYVEKTKGARFERRLRYQMSFIYEDVDFSGKTVLDIGGGVGLHSFYAIANGAKSAVIVEPEGDGGHAEMISSFQSLKHAMSVPNIELIETTFQNFKSSVGEFDIVLIHDAINHFDEPSCIELHRSTESEAVYDEIFLGIDKLIKADGQLMLSDCSSKNIFPSIGLSNPFDRQIEWHKHQPPKVWARLLKRRGFHLSNLRWSSPALLGSVGKVLFGNRVSSWFFTSHFIATFTKPHA